MPDCRAPVAVFDSGLGGISVLRELVRTLPRENYLYFGDSLHAPYGTKTPEEVAQHPLDRGMVVGGQGIRGDLRAAPGRIAFAQRVLVAHGADHDRLRPFDQPSHVEPLVEIPFEVTERGVTPVAEPATEKLLVPHQMAARRYTAQVEACGSGGLSDETAVEHGDNLVQM